MLLNEPSTKSSACWSFTKDRRTPDFIAFGTDTVDFGIQKAEAANDPPSVLTWQIRVTDMDSAIERSHSAGISFELQRNNPAPGWTYRRLLTRTPSGYRLAL